MRKKSFGLRGNYDDFRVVPDCAKSFLTCMENTLKDINILGEEAKSILPYSETGPFDKKFGLSRRIFRSKPNKIYDHKSPDWT